MLLEKIEGITFDVTDPWIDEFCREHIVAMLWAEHYTTDDPSEGSDGEDPDDRTFIDAGVSVWDMSEDAKADLRDDCLRFIARCIGAGVDIYTYDPAYVAHDFWFVRQGHGVGFIDHVGVDSVTPWRYSLTDAHVMDEIAEQFGELYPYVRVSDGKVCL